MPQNIPDGQYTDLVVPVGSVIEAIGKSGCRGLTEAIKHGLLAREHFETHPGDLAVVTKWVDNQHYQFRYLLWGTASDMWANFENYWRVVAPSVDELPDRIKLKAVEAVVKNATL